MAVKRKDKQNDFLNLPWSVSSSDISVCVDKSGMCVTNAGDEDGFLRQVVSDGNADGFSLTTFEGSCLTGSSGILYQVDECNRVLGEATLGSETLFELSASLEHALLIKVFPHSSIRVTKLSCESYCHNKPIEKFFTHALRGNIAVVVPTYPTHENKYPCAFVHARVRAYKESNIKCDVICAYDYESCCFYEYEGVRVLRIPLKYLALALRMGTYQKILMHFFEPRYADILDACDLGNTEIFLWSHNPETRYWDWSEYMTPYFEKQKDLTVEQKKEFYLRDEIVRRYNENDLVTWVFVSEELKTRSEELIGITFNKAVVIPNIVDENVFVYDKKDPSLRKKIFFARKFDNVSTYAIDINVQCIVELSKRPCFSDMEFNIYGAGDFYEELIKPLAGFDNVNLHPWFLTRGELVKVHAQHGIALFATRFDSQGVSMGEAAMSGLAVVSSKIPVAEYFLPNEIGLLAEVENAVSYADIIEKLYLDQAYFLESSQQCHDKVYRMCRREMTLGKEIALIGKSKTGFLKGLKAFSR